MGIRARHPAAGLGTPGGEAIRARVLWAHGRSTIDRAPCVARIAAQLAVVVAAGRTEDDRGRHRDGKCDGKCKAAPA
jgi:proline racemase